MGSAERAEQPEGEAPGEASRLPADGVAAPAVHRLTVLAARLLGASMVWVTLQGREQVLVASSGSISRRQRSGPADTLDSVVLADGVVAVSSTATDPRTAGKLGPAGERDCSYLGVPLREGRTGHLGALSAIDRTGRVWDERDTDLLAGFAAEIARALDPVGPWVSGLGSAAQLDLSADAGNLGTFDYDVRTGLLIWDTRMRALAGVPSEEDIRDIAQFDALVHPDDLARVHQEMEHAVQTLGDINIEYRIRLPDGSQRWLCARGRVLPDAQGQPARMRGVAYDNTKQRSLRGEMDRLLETMPSAFVRVDADWFITYVNASGERLAGRDRSALLGRSLWEALPTARGTFFQTACEVVLSSGKPDRLETWSDLAGTWVEVQIWPSGGGLSFFVTDIGDRRRAEAERARANQRLELLADAGRRLGATLDAEDILQTLGELIVPAFGHWAAIVLMDEVAVTLLNRPTTGDDRRLQIVHVAHEDAARAARLAEVLSGLQVSTTDPAGAGAVTVTGEPEWLPEVDEATLGHFNPSQEQEALLREAGLGAVLTVPLVGSSGVSLGAMSVSEPQRGRVDKALVAELALRAGAALDNAHRLGEERRLALELQRTLLPTSRSLPAGVSIATRYRPAMKGAYVGGDFHQVIERDGDLILVLGDVMGHGMHSAAHMGQLRGIVAALALEGHNPSTLLYRLGTGTDRMLDLEYATLCVCRYELATRELTCASAGHPPPLIVPTDSEPFLLEVDPGAPIGVAALGCPETRVSLGAGATAVLFSDGLIERRGESLDDGLQRLLDAVPDPIGEPGETADHLLEALGRCHGGEDDVALLVVKHS